MRGEEIILSNCKGISYYLKHIYTHLDLLKAIAIDFLRCLTNYKQGLMLLYLHQDWPVFSAGQLTSLQHSTLLESLTFNGIYYNANCLNINLPNYKTSFWQI